MSQIIKPVISFCPLFRYNEESTSDSTGGYLMRLILIMGVCFAFLSAIFTGGYEDKPGKVKK
ncbi:hypothetical protein NCCP2716_23720 [Sporosarcina sp. NCCP-2716]|nr:hypothetical protein NCCP2716_23720 [Sporosarcina sp. NCCP-2716]